MLNGTSSPGPGPASSLATFLLADEQALVSLRRRTRAAGEECGLETRRLRGLSAAVFELAGLFHRASPRARASLWLADGPLLQVLFTIPGTPDELARLRPVLDASLARLRTLADQLTLEASPGDLTVSLGAALPGHRDGPHTVGGGAGESPAAAASGERVTLVEQNDGLQRAVRDLQAELQETNRGVVALYAELEDQAERLRQAEDRLRVLLDSVQEYAICMLDAAGTVESWNAGAERLFGYRADEITGRSFECFYTPADRDLGAPAEHLARALEDGRDECEGLRVRQGGSAFDAHVLLATVRRPDRGLRGFSLVVRDVTERKRLEDDLRRRAEELAAANRAKEEFLATLSHELRTPLNAMLGWTRLLRMGKLDAASRARALETIERNAHVQEQLIADILDVSRIVTGKLRMDLRPVELAPIIDASVDAVRPTAEAKGIALSRQVAPVGAVLGDPDRLQQVFWNLLSNAIKFTPAGGQVHIAVERRGPNAAIAVTDTGEGMAPDLVPYVFDRFTQGDGSVTRRHGGLGLGLSIVRHIVELHGGRVRAGSAGKGRGSRFSVDLPIRAVQDSRRSLAPELPLAGVKVLVVDDEEDARAVVSLALAQCGAHTAAAGSAQEALRVLHQFRPHVLVSDIAMPGEDGYTLIRRVRALGERGLGDVPAVALTGHAETHDRRRALMAGFQQFVAKPVEAEELAAIVRTLAPEPTASPS